ncbi:hypothetical protein BDK51DRAFT_51838 [Blyttiomyces helicus]|uniref:Glycosyltransferase 2-like domain-containing protein n=1 Tax=Blyttiomyces helicus TaxID=388810 RepID=A0A4P9WDH2_9FUNG|nr:hypothetical protein BDK51DRAFT_51838 [Blyttiomyces helicus]|eukprot:RKO89010.1 hypothetical protein BDK51DRAFT_51838 [Blyttiomyces helicus]
MTDPSSDPEPKMCTNSPPTEAHPESSSTAESTESVNADVAPATPVSQREGSTSALIESGSAPIGGVVPAPADSQPAHPPQSESLFPNAAPALPESQLKSRKRSKLAPTEIGSAPAGGVIPADIEPATAPGAEEDFAEFVALRGLDGAGVEETVAAKEYAVGGLSADIEEKSNKRAGWWAHIGQITNLAIILVFIAAWFISAQYKLAVKRAQFMEDMYEESEASLRGILVREAPKIYFVWTKQANTFTERNHKVLEAYLYHHPDAKITVFAMYLPLDFFAPLSAVGYNVQVIRSDDSYLASMSNWCPGKIWIDNLAEHKKGPFYHTHVTDYIRFCALHRWGGIYSHFDAVTLQRLDAPADLDPKKIAWFGRESMGLGPNRTCDWCIVDTDERYATGVMGSPAGHHLIRDALRMGFESEYDASTKDSVIRIMSVASRLRSDIQVLPTDDFYPYGPKSITKALQAADDPEARVDWLRTVSLSLHLYDYNTKEMRMEKGSILEAVFRRFPVLRDPALEGNENRGIAADGFLLKGPQFIGISQGVVELKDVRVIAPRAFTTQSRNLSVSVTLTAKHGKIRLAKDHDKEWTSSLVLSAPNPAILNSKLARILYRGKEVPKGRDSLTLTLHTGATTDPVAWRTVPIYDIGALVTLVVKTWKHNAYRLLASAMHHYPTMHIIVSDDGGGTSHEGEKRGHYYLPLRYNAGVSAARNSMIKIVKTEYFLTLDDDVFIDHTSNIAALVHALETPRVSDGALFDIAAGKSLAQQVRSGFDFCGLLTVDTGSRVLSLGPGYVDPEPHETCRHVEFVANAFIARTKLIRNKLRWDERLKLGELEDFFLRARELGVKTLTCGGVNFHHEPRHAGVDRPATGDYLKLSLKKHRLMKLVSFGTTTMDLVAPARVDSLYTTLVLSRSLVLHWKSSAASHRVLHSPDNGASWNVVSGDENGRNHGSRLAISGLQPGTRHLFRVFASSNYIDEQEGRDIAVKTLTVEEENVINLLQDPSFESNHLSYTPALSTDFRIFANCGLTGAFCGRSAILMGSFTPTLTTVSQTLRSPALPPNTRTLTFVAYGRRRHLLFPEEARWRTELRIWIAGGGGIGRMADWRLWADLDINVPDWQHRTLTVCLAPETTVETIEVVGAFEASSGVVLWDDWILVRDLEVEESWGGPVGAGGDVTGWIIDRDGVGTASVVGEVGPYLPPSKRRERFMKSHAKKY